MRKLFHRIRARYRPLERRDRGVAMLIVLTWLALMISLVGEFTYGTTVDAAQAANARDEMRAHYLARSSVNLSRLLIKIQQKFIDPTMAQAKQMLQQAMGGNSTNQAGGGAAAMGALAFSLRITDYAGALMGFFSGSKEEVSSLGSLVGIDTANIKGLGLKSGSFDAEITSEDGKIDINCGSGGAPIRDRQLVVYRLLQGLMASRRFDRLFSEADQTGNFATRPEVARAIIDWADADDQMFAAEGGSGGGEDYRYDSTSDRYRARDNSFDSLEELKMVRGVSDGFMEAFAPHLTVYASDQDCKVNLGAISNKNGGDCTPLLMGIVRAAAIDPANPSKPPADPTIFDDSRLYPIASIACDRASAAGFDSLQTLTGLMNNPQTAVLPDDPRYKIFQSMQPMKISDADLGRVAKVASPRVYRVVATGASGRVKKKITAIIDTKRELQNPLTINPGSEKAAGVLQYWREE
jgi:general secretion pathway protein K